MSVAVGDSEVFHPLAPRTQQAASGGDGRAVRIGLINNMADGAIARTEYHFTNLLQQAFTGTPLEVVYYSLPTISRSGKIREHVEASYQPFDGLWENPPDAVVVTGAEPRERNLKDELYWDSLAGLIDWLDVLGIPAMFSCLAAHAAVLHLDGIPRAGLKNKCFGVFEHEAEPDHPLMEGAGERMWLPHTRWNQVNEADLAKAGYQILSRSDDVGVGFFAKKRRSMWLFCQGHPEYEGADLLREYRRDIGRFLSGQRETYPDLPRNYFLDTEIQMLHAFRQHAIALGHISVMEQFPRIKQGAPTWDAWRSPAIGVFANWLKQIPGTKTLTDVAGSGYDLGRGIAVPDYLGSST